jgi:hypothetical protein
MSTKITLKLFLAGIAAALCMGSASAQSSTTPTIGYYKVTVPSGTSAWCHALVNKTDFQGEGTVAADKITQTGATWTANQFANTHYVEILSGPQTGAIFDIVSNTGTEITLDTNIGVAPLSITGATTYCVRKHTTLGDVFLTANLEAFDHIISVYDAAGLLHVYSSDGTNIVDGVDFTTPKNDDILYPGQGFLISGSAKQLTFGGGPASYVKTGPTKIAVYQGKVNFVGVMNPLAGDTPSDVSTAATLGLAANLAAFDDTALIYGSTGNFSIVQALGSDGTDVVDGVDFATNKNSYAIKNASAYLLVPGTSGFHTQSQSIP